MIRENTLFVLGAGFSAELGLPLGGRLKSDIVGVMPDGVAGGGHQTMSWLVNKGWDENSRAASAIRAGLPLAQSIDNFVEHHQADDHIVRIAKWGIALCIAKAEYATGLSIEPRHHRDRRPVDPDNAYGDLFRLITAGVSIMNLAAAFERLQVITFNYDRTLEIYLRKALQDYSGLDRDAASEIVGRATILHAYGMLGTQSTEQTTKLQFHDGSNAQLVEQDAQGIRTFSESVASDDDERIKAMTATAERVVVLGCALHRQNMALLKPRFSRLVDAYATVYLVPPHDEHARPSMTDFCEPILSDFKDHMLGWHDQDLVLRRSNFRSHARTMNNRQLIAHFGNRWTE